MAIKSTSFIFTKEFVSDQPIPLQPITPILILSLAEIGIPVAENRLEGKNILPVNAAPAPLMKFLRLIAEIF
jgi:hypothetical protein